MLALEDVEDAVRVSKYSYKWVRTTFRIPVRKIMSRDEGNEITRSPSASLRACSYITGKTCRGSNSVTR